MGFKPTKYDPDVYMRLAEDGHSYDYIGCHTDDLTIVAADAQQVLNQLLGHYVKGCDEFQLSFPWCPSLDDAESDFHGVLLWMTQRVMQSCAHKNSISV